MAVLFAITAAQGASEGSVTGTVTDPSGAAMASIVVSLRNAATGTQREVLTNAQGFYAIAALAIGEYEITVDQVGFAPYRRGGLAVDVSTTLQVDVRMQLSTGEETVTV